MKKIPLMRGKFVIVDDDDFKYLNRFKWTYQITGIRRNVRIYNDRGEGRWYGINIESLILKKKPNEIFIHKNGNLLDCRKRNIEARSLADSVISIPKAFNTNRGRTSKYRGVCWDKRVNRWCAYLTKRVKGKRKILFFRWFKNEKSAAIARNKAVKKHFPKYGYLNKIK
jgi:hypothetical protein